MGNSIVVKNESDYFEKMSTVLNSKAYDLPKEGPAVTTGRKIKKNPLQIKSALHPTKNVKQLLGTKQ